METKEFVLNEKKFLLVKLQAWNRLMFVADLQKDILTPLLDNLGEKSLEGVFSAVSEQGTKPDVMKLLKSLSGVIDSRNLEKWVKRVLSEGMIVSIKDDEQKVKLSFHELTKLFSAPQDIIMLMKEAIVFNLDGILDIIKGMGGKKADTPQIS
ncbi:phage tail assembly chaperone [Klebsiella aerogenes]